ncbi:hypothetical protein J3S90_09460 [Flavobacterium sp. P4023]|uniref:Uncharacterized protein n=1 Tax=Flavobacterium flabelliforme TaxID=2816119 RepID=A0ABS5CTS7_9FLAO|nr:hypothetical protein [Flavobacterium flabelliforme]MBP4142029.1 hypothetical protein [Flavobacterium flabelliforme]
MRGRLTEITVNTMVARQTYSNGVSQVVEEIAGAQNIEIETMKNAVIQRSNPNILLERFINPHEIANLVTYLSNPLPIATNGALLRADSVLLKII